ncbi:uncharacterized protein [Apostichopus japonicus]
MHMDINFIARNSLIADESKLLEEYWCHGLQRGSSLNKEKILELTKQTSLSARRIKIWHQMQAVPAFRDVGQARLLPQMSHLQQGHQMQRLYELARGPLEGSGGLVGGQSPEERPGQLGSREPGKPGKAPAKKPKRPRVSASSRDPGGSQYDPEGVAEVAVHAQSKPLSPTREASRQAEPSLDHEWVAKVAVRSRPSSPTRGASKEAGSTQDPGRPEGPAPRSRSQSMERLPETREPG